MLKWTKRAEPNAEAGSRLSTLLLAPQQNASQRMHARRSLGNLSRPVRTTGNRERQQRKSLGSSEMSKRLQNRDKENQILLTPHPNGFRQNITSTPVIAFGALRDVRNLTPKQNSNSISALLNAMTPSRKRPLAKTPPGSPTVGRVICSSPKESALTATAVITKQTPYASTLPTFDVEYSPCGATQPILPAKQSITTDAFFNPTRYFQEPLPASKRLKFSPTGMTPLSSRLTELRFSKLKFGAKKTTTAVKSKTDKCAVKDDTVMVEDSGNNNNNDNNKNQNECLDDALLMKKPEVPSEPKVQKMPVPSADVSLSSSALDDTALDKMIDAILESARKERPSIARKMALMQMATESPTYTKAEDPASDLNKFCDNFQISPDELIAERTIILEEAAINEREVRTPEPLEPKRPKIEHVKIAATAEVNSCHLKRQRAVRRKNTKCDQQKDKSEPISMETNLSSEQSETLNKEELASPKTPSDSDFVMSSFFKKTADELANMNTPVIDSSDSNATYAQQPQITSISSKMSSDSTPCIHTNDLQASSTPTNIETVNAIRRCLTFSDTSPNSNGSSSTDDSLEKRKSTASSTNSTASISTNIVSGSLDLNICCDNNKINIHVIRCRDLFRSMGAPVNAYVKVALINETGSDSGFQRTAVHRNSNRPFFDHRFTFDLCGFETARLQLAVWHRDREFKRSDFLGCISMPVKSVTKEISGSFKLQPKSSLSIIAPLVPMCESLQSSVDEASHDSTTLTLSKKAIHQRDADENLFLRFLELEAPVESNIGRTPFTVTKKLTRTAETGFGFSIVWTHPARIEKIESGLSAEQCGILPGDYIVFVGEQNVVTMPEIDILNMIKAQGNTLTLEIFRKSSSRPMNNNDETTTEFATPKQTSLARPMTACSNVSLVESSKRRMHLPQVTFAKEVGCGVIV